MQQNSKYIFIIFFLLVLALAFFVILPFLDVILASAIVAYIFYPLYIYIRRFVRNENLSVFLLVIIILAVFTVPSVIAANAVIKDISAMYLSSREKAADNLDIAECDGGSITCSVLYLSSKISSNPEFSGFVSESLFAASKVIFSKASSFVLTIPSIIVDIFLSLFLIFYFIKDGKKITAYINDILPFRENFKHNLWRISEDMFYATIYGGLMLALVQGVFAIIGYYIFGISSPVSLGLMTGVASIIPFIGSAVIWIPLGVSKIIDASIPGSTTPLWQGVGILIYSALIVSTVDNFLKPYVVGRKAGLHPLLVLIGIFGGISLVGAVGVIVGPMVLAFAISLLDAYKYEHYVA